MWFVGALTVVGKNELEAHAAAPSVTFGRIRQ